MKICVTGACGFIGSWITKALLEDGHEVLAIDDLSGGSRGNLGHHPKLLVSQTDLRNTQKVMQDFEWFEPEVVYHLAANAREGASFFQPISVTTRNTCSYVNVLTAAIRYGARRIITFSSIAAYGNQKPPFTEDMPLKPVDIYGLAKMQMEEITKMLAGSYGIEYIIFRPYNVFGERQALNDIYRNVFGIWMNKIMRREPMVIYGDGRQERAFSYIQDSLPCYLKAIDCEPNQIINIGSETPIRVETAAIMTRHFMGASNHPTEYVPDRHKEVKFAYCDNTKAKELLGFEEIYGIDDGIRRMAEWARKRGPQEWKTTDNLEIPNEKTPRAWL